MTIPEAVGLVLVAGLGGYGDLCILEMGEPMLIRDLARLMIAMAGLVPDEDIRIEYIGMRPGEKLDEQLMTDEEVAQSRKASEMIRVVDRVFAPSDLMDRIARLELLAKTGDRDAVLDGLRAIVPEFVPDRSLAEDAPAPSPAQQAGAPSRAAAVSGA
jgi:FlaA1/EpsC-like NDP-sugar epimerase